MIATLAEPPKVLLPRLRPSWAAATVGLVVAAAVLNTLYLFVAPFDLSPDEAHYWDWSRHLAWSYYSKGPFVAWLIRGSCELFGTTAVAVRLPAVACGTLTLFALAALARRTLGSAKLAFLTVAAALTLPPISAGAVLMTIDAPFLCCWAWALVFVHRAVFDGDGRAWTFAGLALLVGTLTKYTMLSFPALVGLFLMADRSRRPLAFARGFRRMTLLGCVGLLPIAWWNATHDWLGVWHLFGQAGLATGPKIGFKWYGPLDYLGGQLAFLAGYWFLVWAAAAWTFRPLLLPLPRLCGGEGRGEGEDIHPDDASCRVREACPLTLTLSPAEPGERGPEGGFAADRLAFLWWLSVPLVLAMLPFSLRVKVQPNWPAAAYLPGIVLAVAWLRRQLVLFPPPLGGRVRVGGQPRDGNAEPSLYTCSALPPTLTLPPKGGGSKSYRRLVLACLVAGTLAAVALTAVARVPQLALPLFAAFAAEPTDDQLAPVRNLDPTARLRGWRFLAGEVDKLRDVVRSEDGQDPLVGTMVWTLPGEIGFYARGNPQVYTFGVALSDRASQYDVWRPNPLADAQVFRGRTFVYVGEKMPDMNAVFERCDGPYRVEYRENGVTVGGWKLWIARGYRGFPAATKRSQY